MIGRWLVNVIYRNSLYFICSKNRLRKMAKVVDKYAVLIQELETLQGLRIKL